MQESLSFIPVTTVVCATLLIYDYLCTLELEINFIWPNPLSFSGILFFLNRYTPFVDLFIHFDLEFSTHNTLEKCRRNDAILTWFVVIGVLISEMILTLRTYAFWSGDKRILAVFVLLIIALGVPCFVFVQMQLSTIQYIVDDYGGCEVTYANPIAIGTYVILVVYESFVAVLTLVKASQQRTNSSWVVRLYTESVIFYIYILAVSLINLIMPIARPSLAKRFAGPLRVLHSVFCNRILFRIVGHRPVGSPRSGSPVLSSVGPMMESDMELSDFTPSTDLSYIGRA